MGSTEFPDYFQFWIGSFAITQSLLTSWLIMLTLFIFSWISTRKLSEQPGNYQILLEGIYIAMHDAVKDVLPEHVDLVFPFISTLWIFILVANLIGIVPGFYSPTADLSVTASLALLTFLSVHWFGIRSEGLKNYMRHYILPSPFLLPFHLISEVSRTLALAIRLFGNIMSLELTALIVLMVAGFLAPIPILMLHIVEAVIQAYIFGMLALIYIAGGIQSQIQRREKENTRE
jgi:F-type H+-transporting ATPase subunit a